MGLRIFFSYFVQDCRLLVIFNSLKRREVGRIYSRTILVEHTVQGEGIRKRNSVRPIRKYILSLNLTAVLF